MVSQSHPTVKVSVDPDLEERIRRVVQEECDNLWQVVIDNGEKEIKTGAFVDAECRTEAQQKADNVVNRVLSGANVLSLDGPTNVTVQRIVE